MELAPGSIESKNTKTPQIIPFPIGETSSTTHISVSFSIQNLVHWKPLLSTAVLGRSLFNRRGKRVCMCIPGY